MTNANYELRSCEQKTTQIYPKRVLRLIDVQNQIGLGRSKIYQMIKAGTFPSPIKLSGKASGWLESEISEWIEKQIAASKASA